MKHMVGHIFIGSLVIISSMVRSEVVWEHSFVVNVTDEDVKWRKKITLPVGTTTIHAVNQDITISLPHDTVIRASESGASILDLKAEAGRVIRVDIDEKLDFRPSVINDNTLRVRWSGEGDVIFDIAREED